jgi:hypothetical protein
MVTEPWYVKKPVRRHRMHTPAGMLRLSSVHKTASVACWRAVEASESCLLADVNGLDPRARGSTSYWNHISKD